MAFPPETNSWPRIPLSPPIAPVFPDFHICHPYYGQRLLDYTCRDAATRLPVGSLPVQYNTHDPYHLPTQIDGEDIYGECIVMVQSTDIEPSLENPPVAPDLFRAVASYILSECVVKNGWGGFGTVMLQNVIDWVANRSTGNAAIEVANWPSPALFYTVTVTSNTNIDRNEPFYKDPAMADAIATGVRQKGNNERAEYPFSWCGNNGTRKSVYMVALVLLHKFRV